MYVENYKTYKDEGYMTRYLHSPSLKAQLVARVQERIATVVSVIDTNILNVCTELGSH